MPLLQVPVSALYLPFLVLLFANYYLMFLQGEGEIEEIRGSTLDPKYENISTSRHRHGIHQICGPRGQAQAVDASVERHGSERRGTPRALRARAARSSMTVRGT